MLVRRCLRCGEIGPEYIAVCYCGGPVLLEDLKIDAEKIRGYIERAYLARLKGAKLA